MPIVYSFLQDFLQDERLPPIRVYLHSAGQEIYEGSENKAKDHLGEVLQMPPPGVDYSQFDYLLAAMWGDEATGEKVIDFFGFSDVQPWLGNPDVKLWVVRNGVLAPKATTCGETLIMLGEEEKYRRKMVEK